MKTTIIRSTAVAWACAGLSLAGWAILDQVSKDQILVGLLMACFGLVGAFAGYAALRDRPWAIWAIGFLALLVGANSVGYFITHGLGWTHGSSDWMALGLGCFSILSVIAVVFEKMRGSAEDNAPNERPA